MVNKKSNKSFFKSTAITILIVAMLIFSGPAQAVQVSMNADNLNNLVVGDKGFFIVNVTIGSNERIPIANITVEGLPDISGSPGGILVFNVGDFNTVGGFKIKGNYNISLNKQFGFIYSDIGYGYGYTNNYGYGYNNQFGYAPFFGYDYGYQFYGYGYGYGGSGYEINNRDAFTELSYKVFVNTAGAQAKTYKAKAKVNAGLDTSGQYVAFTSGDTTFTLNPVRGGNGGGGSSDSTPSGGGGVVSGEPTENIIKYEIRDCTLVSGKPTICRFTTPEHGVYELEVTGKESESVTFRIEALKGLSPLVTSPAPGTKYLNIWANSKRIKEALVRFNLDNTWIASEGLTAGNVRMYNWDGSKWIELDTRILSSDSTGTKFEAKTTGFSHFAISGVKAAPAPTGTPRPITPGATGATGTPGGTAVPPAVAPPSNLATIIIVMVVLIAVILVVYFREKIFK